MYLNAKIPFNEVQTVKLPVKFGKQKYIFFEDRNLFFVSELFVILTTLNSNSNLDHRSTILTLRWSEIE